MVVFINQVRMKIGVMFGNPETTTGGQALKFYSSLRMEVRRVAAIKNGTDVIGNRTRVKVVKNKVAAPFKECEFDIMFGTGISKEGDVLDLGAEAEVIQKSGTWFTYGTERLGQGRENAKEYLKEHPETLKKIEKEVRSLAAQARLVLHGLDNKTPTEESTNSKSSTTKLGAEAAPSPSPVAKSTAANAGKRNSAQAES